MKNTLYTYPSLLLFQEQAQRELTQLRELLKAVEAELSHAPPGSLSITQKGSRTWYYQRSIAPGTKSVYLNEGDSFLRHRLAQKAYDLRLKRAILQQIKQLEHGTALQFADLASVYESFPAPWRELIEPHVLTDDQFAEQWLRHYSAGATGGSFKSKSEYIHHSIYEKLSVPHVYEPPLHLDGYGTIRPDFVVLNRRTRQTFYHEHFGMMDSMEYCQHALAKLEDYHRNGFYEGKNLIITMESSAHPMDPEDVEGLFRTLLL